MAQYDIDLRDYWRIIRKRRSIIIFSMITMAVLSFIFAKFKARSTVDFYASSATIRGELSILILVSFFPVQISEFAYSRMKIRERNH